MLNTWRALAVQDAKRKGLRTLSLPALLSGKGPADAAGRHHLHGHGILSGRDAGSQYCYDGSDVFAENGLRAD